MSTTLTNARLVLPSAVTGPARLRFDEGRISAIESDHPALDSDRSGMGDVLDLGGDWVVPGFVDMHVHGGAGAAFQSGSLGDVQRAADHHLAHGTTTLLASLVSRPLDELTQSVSRLRELVEAGVVAGIHLEGPFLSPARCGAHDPALLCDPRPDRVRRLLAAGAGTIAMLTLAPERDGATEAVRQLVDAGVVVAVGHTDAPYAVVQAAIDAGARVATHLFNGMPPLHHRSPGPVLALLDDDRVTVELIHDHRHLHPAVVRHVFAAAGAHRTALVSDAIAAAGLDDGDYTLGGLAVVVTDGAARLVEGGSLAGSTITVHQGLVNAVADGVDFVDAVTAATATPATAIGLAARAGSLVVGRSADLVVLRPDLSVRAVLRAGTWVGQAPA